MKLSLIVLSDGKAKGHAIPITLSQFLIGRDPQCQLRPGSAAISKRHCAILVKGGKVYVRDFDSTNGTLINDEPVKGERQLRHDDTLKIGPLAFRVVIETSTPVNKPTPPPSKLTAADDDESIAEMLLSVQDDDATAGLGGAYGAAEGPEGSTITEMAAPETPAPAAKTEEAKEPAHKGNTSAAAKEILDMYSRRQRR
jgi:pSer/pThr/pTyr-binding forkhead associated (FHA) protein